MMSSGAPKTEQKIDVALPVKVNRRGLVIVAGSHPGGELVMHCARGGP